MRASELVVFCQRSTRCKMINVLGTWIVDLASTDVAGLSQTYSNMLTRRSHKDWTLQSSILVFPKVTSIRKLGPFGFFCRDGVIAWWLHAAGTTTSTTIRGRRHPADGHVVGVIPMARSDQTVATAAAACRHVTQQCSAIGCHSGPANRQSAEWRRHDCNSNNLLRCCCRQGLQPKYCTIKGNLPDMINPFVTRFGFIRGFRRVPNKVIKLVFSIILSTVISTAVFFCEFVTSTINGAVIVNTYCN